jgi:Rrf2 family transcriptional regulator, iron-sulfur cluster assembly transcription factor
MRLTTKGRYAVTAMLDLALHADKGPVTVSDISLRQGISQAYLEQLFGKLKRARLVVSLRGPGGGYALARPSGAITISDIIVSVDEAMDATRCGGVGDCQDGLICLTHDLWSDLSSRIDDFLSGVTLESLVARSAVKAIARRQDAAAGSRLIDARRLS